MMMDEENVYNVQIVNIEFNILIYKYLLKSCKNCRNRN
jgi:hypothetical protein